MLDGNMWTTFLQNLFSDFNLGNDQVHEITLPTPQFQ